MTTTTVNPNRKVNDMQDPSGRADEAQHIPHDPEIEAFVAGYKAAMHDLNGPMTMDRAGIMWANPELSARSAALDPDWITHPLAEVERARAERQSAGRRAARARG